MRSNKIENLSQIIRENHLFKLDKCRSDTDYIHNIE